MIEIDEIFRYKEFDILYLGAGLSNSIFESLLTIEIYDYIE